MGVTDLGSCFADSGSWLWAHIPTCHRNPGGWPPRSYLFFLKFSLVVCTEFVGTIKVLFPEAEFAVVNHPSLSAEKRKRAYFASAEFDLTALARLTGTCTVAEFFDIDPRALSRT